MTKNTPLRRTLPLSEGLGIALTWRCASAQKLRIEYYISSVATVLPDMTDVTELFQSQ